MIPSRCIYPPKKLDNVQDPKTECRNFINKQEDKPGFSVQFINRKIGKGVIATEDFRTGDFLFEYDGELVSREEAEIREKKYPLALGSFLYFFKFRGKSLCIDATFSKRIGRYANDEFGGRQNAAMELIVVKERPYMAVFARHNIKKGDEVRYDYGVSNLPWRKSEVTFKSTKAKANNKDKSSECNQPVEHKGNVKNKKRKESKNRKTEKMGVSEDENIIDAYHQTPVQFVNEGKEQPEKEPDKLTLGRNNTKVKERKQVTQHDFSKALKEQVEIKRNMKMKEEMKRKRSNNNKSTREFKGDDAIEKYCRHPVQVNNENGKHEVETDYQALIPKDNKSGEQPRDKLANHYVASARLDDESREQLGKKIESYHTVPAQLDNESGEQPGDELANHYVAPVQLDDESREHLVNKIESYHIVPAQLDNESGEQPRNALANHYVTPVQLDDESREHLGKKIEIYHTVPTQLDNESGEQPGDELANHYVAPVQLDNESREQLGKKIETYHTVPAQLDNESREQLGDELANHYVAPVQLDDESREQLGKKIETYHTVPDQLNYESGEQPGDELASHYVAPVQLDDESIEQLGKKIETYHIVPAQLDDESGEQSGDELASNYVAPVQLDDEPRDELANHYVASVQLDDESREQIGKKIETYHTVPVQLDYESGERLGEKMEINHIVSVQFDDRNGEQQGNDIKSDYPVPVLLDNKRLKQSVKELETYNTVPIELDNESGELEMGLETPYADLAQFNDESRKQTVNKKVKTYHTVPVQLDHESGKQPEIELRPYNVGPFQLYTKSRKQTETGLETYYAVPALLDNESGVQSEKEQKKSSNQVKLITNAKEKKIKEKQRSKYKRMRHMEIQVGCQALEKEYEENHEMEQETIGEENKEINRIRDQRRLAICVKECKVVLTRIDHKVPEEVMPVCAICKCGDKSVAEQFLCTNCGFSVYGYQPYADVHITRRLDLECPECKFGLELRIVHQECGKATGMTALEKSMNNESESATNSKRQSENDKSSPNFTSTLGMMEDTVFVQNAVKKKKKPRRPCLFCGAFMADLSRHIMTIHSKEPQVEAASNMPKSERIKAFASFRRKGIFKVNQDIMKNDTSQENLLRDRTQSKDKLVFCSSCLAFISNTYFHKHKRTCCNRDSVPSIDSVPPSLMHVPGDMQDFRDKILSRFHDNKYTSICRSDDLIQRFGNRGYIKMQAKGDKQDEKRKSIMTDMRRLAKLFFHSKKYADEDGNTLNNSVDIFDRQNFKYLESAITYLTIRKDKVKYGLKLSLGYLIKRAALFLKGEYLIAKMDKKAEEIDKFTVVFNHHWSSIFSDAEFAIAIQRQTELRKPQRLPNEEDVLKLREYTTKKIVELGEDSYTFIAKSEFVSLRNLLVCRLTLFNARRGGEPSRLKLTEWSDAENGVWCDPSLVESIDDPLEKMLLCEFKIAYQPGKTSGKLVPLLIPEDCWRAIRRLADLQIRMDAGVHPKNPYLFPYTRASDKHMVGWESVEKCCIEAGLDKNITATNMRHRAATLYAALDVSESERQLFYRHMGHSEEINRDVYQCPQAVLEVTKIGKFFRQLDEGRFRDREDISLSKRTNLSGQKDVINNREHDGSSTCEYEENKTNRSPNSKRKMTSDTDDTGNASMRGHIIRKKKSNDSDYEDSSSDSCDDYVSTPKKAKRQYKKERLYTSWNEKDSKTVDDYFKRYVCDTERSDRKGPLPGMTQLKTFLQLHPDLLSGIPLDHKLKAVKNKIFNERQKRRDRMYKSLEAMKRKIHTDL